MRITVLWRASSRLTVVSFIILNDNEPLTTLGAKHSLRSLIMAVPAAYVMSDIRRYMSNFSPARPPAQQQQHAAGINNGVARRNRRVHDTESSDDDRPLIRRRSMAPSAAAAIPMTVHNAQPAHDVLLCGCSFCSGQRRLATGADDGNAVIVIDDDDSHPAILHHSNPADDDADESRATPRAVGVADDGDDGESL